ncbi:5-oxoprolinase [Coccinella septempunctata]|uniref:5-oxoprolinase n=1 Tax=Coccinella septempunctata TaxID=41139 RepID=UPI001D06AF93|nr:5-oxoprolinase [Coccinella septempunctata]XP_044745500.1 5-oxoprolinase [Coccinella septempunctata]XP_044745501.1 5-oxoprolinase [Coccinella septempunctata]
MSTDDKFQFAIDRGGTFTDVFARCPGGELKVLKLLSEDPQNYNDAPTEGIRRIIQKFTGQKLDRSQPVDNSRIESIRMGTTVATNALLERKGEKMALVINKGFHDILLIGNQARPKIFELDIVRSEVLYSEVVEVDCRVIPAQDGVCELKNIRDYRKITGATGEDFFVVKELDREEVYRSLKELKEKGINSISVSLVHSYTVAEQELEVGKIAEELGFSHISLSHKVMPMVRLVSRGFTSCADAYLTPHVKRYVEGFCKGFKNNLQGTRVLFMQSDGGLTSMDNFNGARAVLSGPAGGVVGYAKTTWQKETDLPVIGFDMGGTSTDVSRFAGSYEHVYESTTAGVTIQAPQLDVNTVAAGGGSMLFFRSGLFVVGPDSAGADPGPACYKKGGPLTVTDANLVLGRLLPEYFPKIFGKGENEALDKEASLEKFTELTANINKFLEQQDTHQKAAKSIQEVAMGFVRVANEAMCRPIRALTQAKGYDTARHALACFGGAGGQHACAIARSLGMSTVFIHKYAGILSAYGMALADVVHEAQEPCAKVFVKSEFSFFEKRFLHLKQQARNRLMDQGFTEDMITLEPYLHMRYDGTDCAIMVGGEALSYEGFLNSFLDGYKLEFGFVIEGRNIVVDDIRIRGVGKSFVTEEKPISKTTGHPKAEKSTKVFFETKYLETKVYQLKDLLAGDEIKGPAIIMDQLSTILVEPDCTAFITGMGDIKITIGAGELQKIGTELDSIQLSIFSHRFMSIAEQMGRILQRTSISTNIKERLDFSCALFGPDGGLVSNAPHIPVHLGSMQEAVQYQLSYRKEFKENDVILSNHPAAGGSHLPDFTVITPVFYQGSKNPVFFVASRGHHADIGGITPGSMPPHSKTLSEEGAAFKSFLLVDGGQFMEEDLIKQLKLAGGRNISENISDLRAQVAANQKGILLVNELIDQYSLNVVQAYMDHIQSNAEVAVRVMLKKVAVDTLKRTGCTVLTAEDRMDDGSPIKLTISLEPEEGTAICDFTGTGVEVWGNCNAPKAITLSALIYCLRCMVEHDVPLNQGCLKPVKVILPHGCILNPSENAAVVGGNVLTSQRVVDVVLKAFRVCAASQGCMNNITFGCEKWGCYETVAGGSGAGPSWNGCSGVHTHMTNTRITDIEILEKRYPVFIRKFTLRKGSGGCGKFRGGDGVEREILFRSRVILSVLTERRVLQPYGMEGGEPGERGLNHLIRADGRIINLGPKTSVEVQPGDVFQLHTPGGGGYGRMESGMATTTSNGSRENTVTFVERGSLYNYRQSQESA